MSDKTPLDIATLADQFKVVASVGRDLQEFCEPLGIDLESIAGPLQIDTAAFEDFGVRISFDRLSRLMEALAMISGDDTFGLKYGQFFRPGGTGPFGMGLRSATSFKDMLRFYAKYIHNTIDIDVFNLAIENDRISLEWTYSPLITRREQFVDYAVAATQQVFQFHAGHPFKLERLNLERLSPRDNSLYLNCISDRVEFGQSINSLVMPISVLDSVNPAGDKVQFDYMSQQCADISNNLRRSKDIVTMLKENLIQHMESSDLAIKDIASRNGMSESTLQRRLAERGTGFWEVYENTRDELSMRLLKDTELSLAEVSDKLGYSSQSAYTRAVKRWHGKTPGQLRQEHRKGHQASL